MKYLIILLMLMFAGISYADTDPLLDAAELPLETTWNHGHLNIEKIHDWDNGSIEYVITAYDALKWECFQDVRNNRAVINVKSLYPCELPEDDRVDNLSIESHILDDYVYIITVPTAKRWFVFNSIKTEGTISIVILEEIS